LARVPFESSRKRGTIVVKREDGSVRVYTKGAPDVLYGKDPTELASYSKQVREENPTFNDD
jgi:magnesium-transporting ATPase (P-type)